MCAPGCDFEEFALLSTMLFLNFMAWKLVPQNNCVSSVN